jgi:hypothetical protein
MAHTVGDLSQRWCCSAVVATNRSTAPVVLSRASWSVAPHRWSTLRCSVRSSRGCAQAWPGRARCAPEPKGTRGSWSRFCAWTLRVRASPPCRGDGGRALQAGYRSARPKRARHSRGARGSAWWRELGSSRGQVQTANVTPVTCEPPTPWRPSSWLRSRRFAMTTRCARPPVGSAKGSRAWYLACPRRATTASESQAAESAKRVDRAARTRICDNLPRR